MGSVVRLKTNSGRSAHSVRMGHFEKILSHTRQYFAMEYKAGTREMIRRYVARYIDSTPTEVSASLQILKNDGTIVYEKGCWWLVSNKI